MSYSLPSLLVKKITFKRLNSKHVKGYEIYGLFQDENYTSGIREELIDYFDNPEEPNVSRSNLVLKYNTNYTWMLPSDMYSDRDHKFRIYINDSILNPLYYQYNKYNKLLTIDKNLKPLEISDKIELRYFKDMITKSYALDDDCSIKVKPIFSDSYTYGTHNVII